MRTLRRCSRRYLSLIPESGFFDEALGFLQRNDERLVIVLHYRLGYSLRQIAKEFQCSYERVRQIHQTALGRLFAVYSCAYDSLS
jgi:hypothetical protein